MSEVWQDIPTWDNGEWTSTSFETKEEFIKYIELDLFKEPGQYNFNKDSLNFREQAQKFEDTNVYCTAPFKSKDFINYWDAEKRK